MLGNHPSWLQCWTCQCQCSVWTLSQRRTGAPMQWLQVLDFWNLLSPQFQEWLRHQSAESDTRPLPVTPLLDCWHLPSGHCPASHHTHLGLDPYTSASRGIVQRQFLPPVIQTDGPNIWNSVFTQRASGLDHHMALPGASLTAHQHSSAITLPGTLQHSLTPATKDLSLKNYQTHLHR